MLFDIFEKYRAFSVKNIFLINTNLKLTEQISVER